MGAAGFWQATTRGFSAALAWLYDHEPVRAGLYVQGAIGGIAAWLIKLVGQLNLGDELNKIVLGGIGLLAAVAIHQVSEWQRSRVSNAATSAKLLVQEPPASGKPPIPLAEMAAANAAAEAKSGANQ